jgi:hypothetical protein
MEIPYEILHNSSSGTVGCSDRRPLAGETCEPDREELRGGSAGGTAAEDGFALFAVGDLVAVK